MTLHSKHIATGILAKVTGELDVLFKKKQNKSLNESWLQNTCRWERLFVTCFFITSMNINVWTFKPQYENASIYILVHNIIHEYKFNT